MQPLATTDRTLLRPVEVRDRSRLLAAMRASRDYLAPWSAALETDAEFGNLLAGGSSEEKHPFLICRRSDDELAGLLVLGHVFRRNFASAYLGYSGFVTCAGQGHMTEGVRLLLSHAFGRLDLHRVEANIQPGNERSKALARRVGFRLEGYSPRYLRIGGAWRDHERYAITAEEWPVPSGEATAPAS